MNAKKLIQSLDEKDMDRRDFLKYAGMLALGLATTKTALGLILPPVENKQFLPKTANQGKGFGSSRYGV